MHKKIEKLLYQYFVTLRFSILALMQTGHLYTPESVNFKLSIVTSPDFATFIAPFALEVAVRSCFSGVTHAVVGVDCD